tara:strand:- start:1979 stop:3538 length:1560 start_codon:yes stop_codon:yes gene_type:complete
LNKISKDNASSFLGSLSKVSGWTGISRIFGLIRDISTTSLLGASVFHDIFVITLKIPNVFRRFFAEGAFNQAFIPIYSDYQKNKNESQTLDFLNSLAGFLITFLFFFTIMVLIFAPIFIFIFAPGFYFDPIKKDLSIEVLRIMFPYLALISLVAFAGGIQNSHARFSLPAFTPILFNLCLIIAALLIAPKYDMPIFVLAWGVLLAGFLQLLIQFIPLFSLSRLPIPKLDFKNSGLKKFFVLILPAIFAGGIIQINLLVDTIFASLLETGSPTWLYVSDRLIQFPMGIFAIAIGTVLLPTLSKIDLQENKQNFIDSLQKAQTFVLFIGLPSLIGLFFCAEDLISTIFLRGEFKIIDVYKSSYSLMAFSLGLPFFMLMKVLTPAFFARKDTKTPMYVALLALFSNVILNYVLAFVFGYGHVGIAIGSSIATLISVLILELILIRDGLIKISRILSRFNVAILTGSIGLIAFLKFFSNSVDFITLSQGSRIFYLLIEVAIAISIYFALTRLVYGKNLKEIFN